MTVLIRAKIIYWFQIPRRSDVDWQNIPSLASDRAWCTALIFGLIFFLSKEIPLLRFGLIFRRA
jgi:hypothetical protein